MDNWLYVDLTDEWIMADLDVDPGAWAREVVRMRASEQKIRLGRRRVAELASLMVSTIELAQAEDPRPTLLLFLAPDAGQFAITSVSVRAEPVDDGVTLHDLVEQLKMPAEMLEQARVEETVQTRSGTAFHVIQRYRDPVDPGHEIVMESEAFGWILEDFDGPIVVLLSTSYLDMVAAATWRPQLAALASSLVLKSGPDETPAQ